MKSKDRILTTKELSKMVEIAVENKQLSLPVKASSVQFMRTLAYTIPVPIACMVLVSIFVEKDVVDVFSPVEISEVRLDSNDINMDDFMDDMLFPMEGAL